MFSPKTISYFAILIATHADCLIPENAENVVVGVACLLFPAVKEGQQAIGEVKGLREQNQTLQSHNQTLQNSLESANAQVSSSQAAQATLAAQLNAAYIAKQQVEAASTNALKEVGEKLYNALQQVSIRDVAIATRNAAIAALGTTLAIGATAVVAYAVYRGVSSYMHNKSKTAAHQQLKACTEGDPASWAQNRNCEKQFQEFAQHAQGEELLREQRQFSTRMRTAQS